MPRLPQPRWNENSGHSGESDTSLIQPRGIWEVFIIQTKLYSVRMPSLSRLGLPFMLKPYSSLIHSRIDHLRAWCILVICWRSPHVLEHLFDILFLPRHSMLGWGITTYIFPKLDTTREHYAKSYFHIITSSDMWQPLTEPNQPQKMGATFCPLKSVVSDPRGEEDFWHSCVVSYG